jgi:ribosome maturation factor RimP
VSQGAPDRLRTAAARIAASYGLVVFDLQFRRESIGWVLRVVLDREPPERAGGRGGSERGASEEVGTGHPAADPEAGVTIGDCRRVSEDLSAQLDVEPELAAEIGDRNYTLEVSSPGLDRPLRHEADYRRFTGRLAKIVTREPVARQTAFAGRLAGVDAGHVLLAEGRRTHRIPLAAISRARLDVEF